MWMAMMKPGEPPSSAIEWGDGAMAHHHAWMDVRVYENVNVFLGWDF